MSKKFCVPSPKDTYFTPILGDIKNAGVSVCETAKVVGVNKYALQKRVKRNTISFMTVNDRSLILDAAVVVERAKRIRMDTTSVYKCEVKTPWGKKGITCYSIQIVVDMIERGWEVNVKKERIATKQIVVAPGLNFDFIISDDHYMESRFLNDYVGVIILRAPLHIVSTFNILENKFWKLREDFKKNYVDGLRKHLPEGMIN